MYFNPSSIQILNILDKKVEILMQGWKIDLEGTTLRSIYKWCSLLPNLYKTIVIARTIMETL